MIKINSEIKTKKFVDAVGELDFDENDIPLLTLENVKKIDDYVKEYSSYAEGWNNVKEYFEEHKGDTCVSSIITKIILIDALDSTNLKKQLGKDYFVLMAKRIKDSNIEEQIATGNPIEKKIFENIASWPVKEGKKKEDMNLFIFLSKYITRINELSYGRNDYSIMDNVIRKNIYHLRNNTNKSFVPARGKLSKYRNDYDYEGYCAAMGKIIDNFPGITRSMLDHFVWFVFKEPAANDK